jgi:restriction endonuclease Mrr
MLAEVEEEVDECQEALDEVASSLQALDEEVALAIAAVQRQAALADREGRTEEAHALFGKVRSMRSLRRSAALFGKEWALRARYANDLAEPPVTGGPTPEEAFCTPILEALVLLGGQAPVGEVLAEVGRAIKDRLNEADLEYQPGSRSLRWRNAARWARQRLVREGLVTSPGRGIWAISDKGREHLGQ